MSNTNGSVRLNMICFGSATWMASVAAPFAKELTSELSKHRIGPAEHEIAATSGWYSRDRRDRPINALGWNEFFTIQFLVQDGLGIWVLHRGFDEISAGLKSALRKLIHRQKTVTAPVERGIAFRIEAAFRDEETVISLEADLHVDTDAAT